MLQKKKPNKPGLAGLKLIKGYSPPEGGRIALSANERIDEFLDFAIQAKFAYVNKLSPTSRGLLDWTNLDPGIGSQRGA